MSGFTMPAHGDFCWNELTTTDVAAAKRFYSELLGWQFKESQFGEETYTEILIGGKAVGGMYRPGPECNAETRWMSYVAVEDVDAAAARVEGLGGKVCVPPTDIPTVGRFSVVSDPSGATISLITLSGMNS